MKILSPDIVEIVFFTLFYSKPKHKNSLLLLLLLLKKWKWKLPEGSYQGVYNNTSGVVL